jgi:acetolactate synthase small subunit
MSLRNSYHSERTRPTLVFQGLNMKDKEEIIKQLEAIINRNTVNGMYDADQIAEELIEYIEWLKK